MPLAVHFKNRCSRSVIRTRLHVSPSRSHNRRACASVSLSPGISRYSLSIRSSSVEIRGVSRVCVTGRRSTALGTVIGCRSRAARAASRVCSVGATRRAAGGWPGWERRAGIAVVVSGIPLGEANIGPARARRRAGVGLSVGTTCRRTPRALSEAPQRRRFLFETPGDNLKARAGHRTHTKKLVPSHRSASGQ